MSYFDDLTFRNEFVDDVQGWLWPKADNGGWDGPKKDWEAWHSHKYFEYVKNYNVCIQAGGNCGMYPRLLGRMFQVVYTFEPDPLNFHCLVNNCQLNNVIKINAALGDSHKMVVVNRKTMSNVGMHKVSEDRTGAIPQFMIDDLALPTCDFICLDVEDYELSVLKGAVRTIHKFHPVISAENGKAVEEFLGELGYKRVDMSVADSIFIVEE